MTEKVPRFARDRRAANFSAHEALEIFALSLVAENDDRKATSSCHGPFAYIQYYCRVVDGFDDFTVNFHHIWSYSNYRKLIVKPLSTQSSLGPRPDYITAVAVSAPDICIVFRVAVMYGSRHLHCLSRSGDVIHPLLAGLGPRLVWHSLP